MTVIKGLLVLALAASLAPTPGFAAESPRAQALDAAVAEIKAAEQALREAEERQRSAVEPLPGERLGNVGGQSRLAPEYFDRQRTMADEVDAARARLNEAYRLRNQLRD
jgi:PAS domain-containing protein